MPCSAPGPDPVHGTKREPLLLGWCHRRVRGLLASAEVEAPWKARLRGTLLSLQQLQVATEGSVSRASEGSSEALTEAGIPLWETRVESWLPSSDEDLLTAVTDCVDHSTSQKRAEETSGLLSTRRISVRVVLLCLNNNVELGNIPWQRVQGNERVVFCVTGCDGEKMAELELPLAQQGVRNNLLVTFRERWDGRGLNLLPAHVPDAPAEDDQYTRVFFLLNNYPDTGSV